jgi:hypothetical protein
MNLAGTLPSGFLLPRLEVAANELDKGRQEFPVNNRVLNLNDDIRIEYETDTPRSIAVTWDQVEDGYLPVELPTLEHVPAGVLASMTRDRTQVKVSAPRSRLDELRQKGHHAHFMPISLEGTNPQLATQRVERLTLTDMDPLVQVTEEVLVTITLRPRVGEPRVVSLPVAIRASREVWEAGHLPTALPRVELTIHGPENLLQELKPGTELTAFIQLRHAVEADAPQELPVQLLAPAWLTWDPVTVTVK